MESNRTYHLLFKYGLLIAGLFTMLIPPISFISPDAVVINGETGALTQTTTIIIELIASGLVFVFLMIKNKFAIVELRNQSVTIKHAGWQQRTVNWIDIESVSQIQFIFPPLYSLKPKDSEQTVWFNTKPRYLSVNGHITDISDMGDLIRKKKSEFGL
jgi:hypothetical protein